jgi:drug/metabolite transporter (DMT)-like permease
MPWLVFDFSGPVLWAVSTHLDKYLVERFFKDSDVAVLLVFTALIGLATLPFIWLYEPGVLNLTPGSIALMTLAGMLYMGAILFYLKALQGEEASVVAPFFQASPLFGYVLAYLVLGERLSAAQMLGGAMIVTGTLSVSIRWGASAARFKARLALLMLACGFILAVSALIFKYFALRDEFWTTTFWYFVGQAFVGLIVLTIARYRRQFLALLRSNTAALISIGGANELINLGGSLGMRYALLFAPLSIVQAIGSTTTLFVFALGAVLSLFLPRFGRERLTAGDLVQKGLAALLVAAGVFLVTR